MSHEHEQKHISPRARRREEAKRRTRIAVPFFAVLFALTIVAFIRCGPRSPPAKSES